MNDSQLRRTVQPFVEKIQLKDPDKYNAQGWHVFSQLGGQGFHYWLREGFLLALQDKAEALKSLPLYSTQMEALLRTIEVYKAVKIEVQLQQCSPTTTKKFDKLVQLLNTLMLKQSSEADDSTAGSNPFRGIIFVQQKCLCYTMTHCLNLVLSPAREICQTHGENEVLTNSDTAECLCLLPQMCWKKGSMCRRVIL
jgi:hypothetical protein